MENEDTFLELELPSKLLPYRDLKVTKIEARVMRGSDEKILAEMTSDNIERQTLTLLTRIIRGIDPAELTLGDRLVCMLWNTINSYTKDYPIDGAMCAHCLKKSDGIILDLQELETVDLPDDYLEPFPVELPVCGQKVMMRSYRIKDELQFNRYEKNATAEQDDIWLYKLALSIVDDKTVWDRVEWLKTQSTKDLAMMRAFHEKYSHGVKLISKFTCTHCEEESPTEVPFRPQLFIPDGATVARSVGAELRPNVPSKDPNPVPGAVG